MISWLEGLCELYAHRNVRQELGPVGSILLEQNQVFSTIICGSVFTGNGSVIVSGEVCRITDAVPKQSPLTSTITIPHAIPLRAGCD